MVITDIVKDNKKMLSDSHVSVTEIQKGVSKCKNKIKTVKKSRSNKFAIFKNIKLLKLLLKVKIFRRVTSLSILFT